MNHSHFERISHMKKILLWSAILGVLVGILIGIYAACSPTKAIEAVDLYDRNTAYSILRYNYGTFLKSSRTDGTVINTVRLPTNYHGNTVSYLDMAIYENEIYVIGTTNSEYFVTRYKPDLGGATELLNVEYESNVHSQPSMYVHINYDENLMTETDMLEVNVIYDHSTVSTHTIAGTGIHEPEHSVFELPDTNDATWANKYYNIMVYKTRKNDLCITNGARTVFFEPKSNESIYDILLMPQSVYAVDLYDISLKEYFIMDGVLYPDMGIYTLDEAYKMVYGDTNDFSSVLTVMPSDKMFSESVTFSEMYDIRPCANFSNAPVIVGLHDADNGSHYILARDMWSSTSYGFRTPRTPVTQYIMYGTVSALVAFAIVFVIIMIIRGLLSMRRVVIKQILISFTVILIAWYPVHALTRMVVSSIVNTETISAATGLLKYIVSDIDPEEFSRNGLSEDQLDAMYTFERSDFKDISNETDVYVQLFEPSVSIDYIEITRYIDGVLRYEYCNEVGKGAMADYFRNVSIINNNNPNGDKVLITNYTEEKNNYIAALYCIKDDAGNIIGHAEICMAYDLVAERIGMLSRLLTAAVVVILLIITLLYVFILNRLLKPLKQIQTAVSEISSGKIGTTVFVDSHDEFQNVANSFSEMSVKLEKYFDSINVVSKAYEKYLPRDFVRLMDKDTVLDINAGDHRERRLAYIFININEDITAGSDNDSFSALNLIYGVISDVLSNTNGAIQSFSGKCITAIFHDDTSEAVEAALAIQETLGSNKGYENAVTISMHIADSIIGVIGSGSAMKTVTVSAAIGLSEYLAEVIRRYHLTYVITKDIHDEISNKKDITTRFIGTVRQLLGDNAPDIPLYEVVDGCPSEIRKLRMATLASYNSALDDLNKNDTIDARAALIDVIRSDRNDLIARKWLNITENSSKTSEEIH